MLWDKYEPKKLDDYLGKEAFIASLKEWVEDDALPHLILEGPPGTGKTLMAHLIRDFYLKERSRVDWHEVNGANERKLDDMRAVVKKILLFSMTGKKKLVFIDEAEGLTPDAWEILKVATGERMYTSKAIFIFATNDISAFPEFMISRCTVEHFDQLPKEIMKKGAMRVLKGEGMEKPDEALVDAFIEISGGDMRKLIGTHVKNYIANPSMTVADLPASKAANLVKVVTAVIDKVRPIKTEYRAVKMIVEAIKTLREKLSIKEIIPAFVESVKSIDLAEFSGFAASWIRQGVPEEIAMVAFASKVVKCV